MAFCSNCGNQLADGMKFCASCGTPAGGTAPAMPATEKVGNIRKCPACGAEVPAMTAKCPDCGHEFSNVKANSTVQAFFEKLDALEDNIYEKESNKKEKGAISGLLGDVMSMSVPADEKRRMALIEGYPIPNSKEDILEFLILATSRIKPLPSMFGGTTQSQMKSAKGMNGAWAAKCQQAYSKAKIALSGDKDALEKITATLQTVDAKKCGVKFKF